MRLVNRRQAAEVLGTTPATLASWRTRGVGPPLVLIGRRGVRYDLDALERYVRERTVPASEMATRGAAVRAGAELAARGA
jgi:phage terminase Nu1 subunit (DNA packaging protein)